MPREPDVLVMAHVRGEKSKIGRASPGYTNIFLIFVSVTLREAARLMAAVMV